MHCYSTGPFGLIRWHFTTWHTAYRPLASCYWDNSTPGKSDLWSDKWGIKMHKRDDITTLRSDIKLTGFSGDWNTEMSAWHSKRIDVGLKSPLLGRNLSTCSTNVATWTVPVQKCSVSLCFFVARPGRPMYLEHQNRSHQPNIFILDTFLQAWVIETQNFLHSTYKPCMPFFITKLGFNLRGYFSSIYSILWSESSNICAATTYASGITRKSWYSWTSVGRDNKAETSWWLIHLE